MRDETESMYSRLNQKALAKRHEPPRNTIGRVYVEDLPLDEWISTRALAEHCGVSMARMFDTLNDRKDLERRFVRSGKQGRIREWRRSE